MVKLEPLPIKAQFLKEYALSNQRKWRSSGGGAQLRHHSGQSLEFREHTIYIPGDDVRHIDWLASARGRGRDLLVRRFHADESFHLVISIDHRESMCYPQRPGLSKIQASAWLAEALAAIALYTGDQVRLHSLFGRRGQTYGREHKGPNSLAPLRADLNRLVSYQPQAKIDISDLGSILPPTAIWVILTDLYFIDDKQATQLAGRIRSALEGWRTILLIEMNSWPYEKALLGEGPRRIAGPGFLPAEYEIDGKALETVHNAINVNRQNFHKMIDHRGWVKDCWDWEDKTQMDAAHFFKERFQTDLELRKILRRQE